MLTHLVHNSYMMCCIYKEALGISSADYHASNHFILFTASIYRFNRPNSIRLLRQRLV
jgi:hypothetical protein